MRTFKVVLQSLSVALMLLCSVTVAQAATIEFFGSRDSFNGPASVPNPSRCGLPAPPNLFVTVPTGPGVSNLGAFVHHDTHCINVATGNVFDGLFEWDFGSGNTMLGTFLGNIKLPAIDGVTTFIETFTLTGGTGIFKDATGSFLGTGFGYFRPTGVDTHMDFKGQINLVPEPGTMALLTLGLASLLVVGLRRHG